MKPNSVHGGVKTHSSRSSSRRSELIALKQAEAESAKIKLKYTQQQQEAALTFETKGRIRSESLSSFSAKSF
ncbi:hypothetical protein DPMN_118927 [Dreissena polymorpha]|uniref:Uncharacterized protein n=1 Tax=Dreissena polymorpha TaxID=45954 RepID=A0A9D4GKZ6_DREPO|nr:hypothetical protein DPMN_118927 [Dreissena polymorpha]